MQRTVNLWVFTACLALMVLVFGCVNASIAGSIDDVKKNHQQALMQQADLKGRQEELEAEEEAVGTDAFVEQQARDLYGYMMPDELRFVITFPDENTNEPSL